MRIENIKLLRCPEDSSELALDIDSVSLIEGDYISEGKLCCKNKNHQFFISNGIPQLIPLRIKRQLTSSDLKINQLNLSTEEKYILGQIKAMDKMATGYRKYVVDPLKDAVSSAVNYERYEDIYLRNIIEKNIAQSKNDNNAGVVFIDVGTGPGRYLIQYGGKTEFNEQACEKYRKRLDMGSFYTYDKNYADNLKLMIGIDLSEGMLKSASAWIKENNLYELIYKDRIALIQGVIQHLDLCLNSTPYENSYKVVCCAFQTLGNQPSRDLQIKLLQKMKDLAKPHGTIFISVFNKSKFIKYFREYYQRITGSIGKIISTEIEHNQGTLRTDWGIFSHWLTKSELMDLFMDASKRNSYSELANVKIESGSELPLFDKYFEYLSKENQEEVRERAIIATLEI